MTQRGLEVKRRDQFIQRLKARVQCAGRPVAAAPPSHPPRPCRTGAAVRQAGAGPAADAVGSKARSAVLAVGARVQFLLERLQQRLQAGCTGPDGSAGAGDRLGGIGRRAGGRPAGFRCAPLRQPEPAAPSVAATPFTVCSKRAMAAVSPCAAQPCKLRWRTGQIAQESAQHVRVGVALAPQPGHRGVDLHARRGGSGGNAGGQRLGPHAPRDARSLAIAAGVLAQHVHQMVQVERFADVVVHARGEARLAVAGHRIRRHRHDRQALLAKVLADATWSR